MISLSLPSGAPLESGADLIAHLAASPRPAIIHYAPSGRTELSGRVAVNWATKMSHLVDSYGIAHPDTALIDVATTWRSLVLALGTAWCDLEVTADAAEAAMILTDRPENYPSAAAEIFVTQYDPVDPALVDVDSEVLSHADQALLPVPDLIGTAQQQAAAQPPHDDEASQISVLSAGTLVRGTHSRLTAGLWWNVIDAWRRSTPVVLVDEATDAQLARVISTERLDPPRA